MDKIFNSTFDFFSYAIPGSCILLSFLILDKNIEMPVDFFEKVKDMTSAQGVFILIIGYTIGFAVYPIGRWIYKRSWFQKWFEGTFKDLNPHLEISDKYILIREFSEANFNYVEKWNMYCAMAHNLAVAALICILLGIIKPIILEANYLCWVAFSAGGLLLFVLFTNRAVKFAKWAAVDINSTITLLNLEKHPKLTKNS